MIISIIFLWPDEREKVVKNHIGAIGYQEPFDMI